MPIFRCNPSNCAGEVTFTVILSSKDLLSLNITRTKLVEKLGEFYKLEYPDKVKATLLEVLEKLK